MTKEHANAGASSTDPKTVSYDGKDYAVIREGLASILVPPGSMSSDGKETAAQQVFYNSIQQFNRDLTVLAIKAFWEDRLSRGKGQSATKKNNKRKRAELDHAEHRASKAAKATSESHPQTTTSQEGGGAPKEAEAEAVVTTKPEPAPEPAPKSSHCVESVRKDETEQKATETADLASGQAPSPPIKGAHTHTPTFTILDALSASGLRALRYGHELPFVTSVTANDLTASAVKSIELNVQHNKLKDKVTVSHDDALAHMYRRIADHLCVRSPERGRSNKYDVIDLDPYGTAAPFLDGAVQAVKDGGLLCVTCTDSAIWAGHAYSEKSYALYGGTPVKGFYSHEAGLRLILHAIATSAARYSLTIEPLLSLSVDYYVRIFVRVTRSQANLKFLASKTMTLYHCGHGCGAWEPQYMMRSREINGKKGSFYKHTMAQAPSCDRYCPHCKNKMHLAGPMYAGYIHSPSFIRRILDGLPSQDPSVYGTLPRVQGMLQTALEEFIPVSKSEEKPEEKSEEKSENRDTFPKEPGPADVDPTPFYFSNALLAGSFQASTPPEGMMRGALRHLGYEVTRSHCRPGSLKTNAPWSTIMWIMREWIRQRAPVRTDKIKRNSSAWRLLDLDNDAEMKDGNGEVEPKRSPPKSPPRSPPRSPRSPPRGSFVRPDEKELRKTLVFDKQLESLGRQRGAEGITRYQANPRKDWGPMSKARG